MACGGEGEAEGEASSTPTQAGTVNCSTFAGQAVTAADFSTPCAVDDATSDLLDSLVGELFVAGTATTLCEDGTVLLWKDLGWGLENDVFTLHSDGAEKVPPADVRDRCETEPETT